MSTDESKVVSPKKHRILIVDDEEQIRDMFKLFIETDFPGVEVDTAANGGEAVQRFLEGRHTVILMDLHMPIMDGAEAFMEIEDHCKTVEWDVPTVLFCTAYDAPCDANRVVKEYELAQILKKPIANEALMEAVKKALGL